MLKHSFGFLFFVVFMSHSGVYGQCRNLKFEEGVMKKLLSPDLFNTAINSEFLGCPQFSQGDSNLCGIVRNREDKWDINLPDGLIFTAFFEPGHYAICKEVFKDAFFLESLKNISEPSLEALTWFNERKNYHTTLISTNAENQIVDTLDLVQRKMLTVMHQIRSWTFCPEENSTDLFIVHGSFDVANNIVIYNTACKAGKIYDADTKTMALALRLYFVCSHEFSHAMDRCSGLLLNTLELREKSEKRANVNGLIITLAFCKLLKQMFYEYKSAIARTPNKATCDEYYLDQLIKEWAKVDKYFSDKIREAKRVFENKSSAVTVSKRNPNWAIFACLESRDSNIKRSKSSKKN